ncbi:MFS transporter [Parabacteroides sp. OttesenSCG-928-G06]|nr:MFS transporter [Parabacteroides sp. OttesenSCG-928-K15]MDL2282309.1 MFS transporter [Parabacteroides sp. OttesenSCG-928-G06]
MLKNHPKGLLVAFFTNMGERFGFYTMMAILVLFLQTRYGLDEQVAGDYYSWFYFAIYALALVGGIVADWTKKYKTVIMIGQIVMFAGYCLMAVPDVSLGVSLLALLIIAFGNGLFKGNLQAVVGQLYDNEKYGKLRDSAFMIFYMGINIGAFFAPYIAMAARNWWLSTKGFEHDGSLPSLCHNFLDGKLADTAQLQELANKVSGEPVADLTAFANQYLGVFAEGYNWAFAIAAVAMVISLVVYLIFNKALPNVEKKEVAATEDKPKTNMGAKAFLISLALMLITAAVFYVINPNLIGLGFALGLFLAFVALMFQISTKEERPRVSALVLVFVVVIFFWMSFHQNGLTLTYFARDYIAKEVSPWFYLIFNLNSILCVIGAVAGAVLLFKKQNKNETLGLNAEAIQKMKKSNTFSRIIGGVMFVGFSALCYWFTTTYDAANPIGPEVFQSFNPLFIVALTPVVMGFFSWLEKKGIVLSTPKKIGFGMIIAAIGFVFVLLPSIGVTSPKDLAGGIIPEDMRVGPQWLLSTYLVLTIAELFLSPMGLSFVSKVAPPRFQGMMQSGWLLATATGNKLLFIGSALWGRIDLYMLWGIFIICCVISAIFIFSIMKRLEKVAG